MGVQVITRTAMRTVTAPGSSSPGAFNPSLFTISLPSGGLLPRNQRSPPPQRAGGLVDDSRALLSVKSSLFKGLAGEGAKFKARLPEKITCHIKLTAI